MQELELVKHESVLMNLSDQSKFEQLQRAAKMIASSDLVPKEFQYAVKKEQAIANVFIALELADRLKASPFMVMQNLYIVYGKPSFSSTFLIASINSSGKFAPLKFDITGEKDNRTCIAWTTDKEGSRLESPPVSIDIAKKEGWYDKNGSKWKTMPEVMLRYRAASFFAKLYAPEITMGMQTTEEMKDIDPAQFREIELPQIKGVPAQQEINLEVEEVKTETKTEEKPKEEPKTLEVEEVIAEEPKEEEKAPVSFEDVVNAIQTKDTRPKLNEFLKKYKSVLKDLDATGQAAVRKAIANQEVKFDN